MAKKVAGQIKLQVPAGKVNFVLFIGFVFG